MVAFNSDPLAYNRFRFYFAAPSPPKNLDYVKGIVTGTTVNVTFDPSNGAELYVVQRAGFNDNTSVASYQFNGLEFGTTYEFSVIAVSPTFLNRELTSESSNAVTVTTGLYKQTFVVCSLSLSEACSHKDEQ